MRFAFAILSLTGLYAFAAFAELAAPREDPVEICAGSLQGQPVDLHTCDDALLRVDRNSVEAARINSLIAMAHLPRNDLMTARAYMDRALARFPDDAIVQGNLGNLLLREGNYVGAITAFNAALVTLEGRDAAAAYLNRALALRAIGRYDEAAKDYQLYLQLTGHKTGQFEDEMRPAPDTPRDFPQSDSST